VGKVSTQVATAQCNSPIGFCFIGTLETNTKIEGTTFFTAETLTQLNEGGTLVSYTGTFVVTLRNNDQVVFKSSGLIDAEKGTFWEVDVADPEDDGKGPSGRSVRLGITGTTSANLSAFSGDVFGVVCTKRR
jgi:hypothetical protein